MKYKVGDKVTIKTYMDLPMEVSPDDTDYSTGKLDTEIVGYCAIHFDYVILFSNGWDVNKSDNFELYKVFGAKKDINSKVWCINESIIIEKKYVPPPIVSLSCCECKDYYQGAEVNLIDGRFCCYSCRDSKRWKYSELVIKK